MDVSFFLTPFMAYSFAQMPLWLTLRLALDSIASFQRFSRCSSIPNGPGCQSLSSAGNPFLFPVCDSVRSFSQLLLLLKGILQGLKNLVVVKGLVDKTFSADARGLLDRVSVSQ